MLYSVWNQTQKGYDYYEAPDKADGVVNAPKPKHLSSSVLGISPESASWPLPSNAKRVGFGRYPKGRVASSKGVLSGLGSFLGVSLTPLNILVLGALGYFAWKKWGHKL